MHLYPKTKQHVAQSGFTLVELLVSLSVFSVVIVIALGTLLVMIDVNAKAQALYSSSTNLSFALDSMSREIRTGYKYNCANMNAVSLPNQSITNDCPSGDTGISFTRERDGRQMAYRKNGSVIEQHTGSGWVPITSINDVEIDELQFRVRGADSLYGDSDDSQPVIDVFIRGRMSNGLEVDTNFSIQTRVTSRRLDII